MAGSLAHIVAEDGHFTMQFIENLGDAHEALEECFEIIRLLAEDSHPPHSNMHTINEVCQRLNFPGIDTDLKPEPPDEDDDL